MLVKGGHRPWSDDANNRSQDPIIFIGSFFIILTAHSASISLQSPITNQAQRYNWKMDVRAKHTVYDKKCEAKCQ